MTDREWLDNLKVGDAVAVICNDDGRLSKITAVRKLHFVVGKDSLYRRSTGYPAGNNSGWYRYSIEDPASDRAKEVLRVTRCRALRREIEIAANVCHDEAALTAALAALVPTTPLPDREAKAGSGNSNGGA